MKYYVVEIETSNGSIIYSPKVGCTPTENLSDAKIMSAWEADYEIGYFGGIGNIKSTKIREVTFSLKLE